MKIYLVRRWGNPEDPDGPDGEDTNFIIRASSPRKASEIADDKLKDTPTKVADNRRVQNFCHNIVELVRHKWLSTQAGSHL